MKARQFKKLNKKAMQLMIQLGYAKEDHFSLEDGDWVLWFPCGGYSDEWDYKHPFYVLHEHAFWSLHVFDDDGDMRQSREIRNAKDAFELFRSDVTEFNSWVLG